MLREEAHCAGVHKWDPPVILSNDSSRVIGIKVAFLLLRKKFIKLNPFASRKAIKIPLFLNINAHTETSLFLFLLALLLTMPIHRAKTKQSAAFVEKNGEIRCA